MTSPRGGDQSGSADGSETKVSDERPVIHGAFGPHGAAFAEPVEELLRVEDPAALSALHAGRLFDAFGIAEPVSEVRSHSGHVGLLLPLRGIDSSEAGTS